MCTGTYHGCVLERELEELDERQEKKPVEAFTDPVVDA